MKFLVLLLLITFSVKAESRDFVCYFEKKSEVMKDFSAEEQTTESNNSNKELIEIIGAPVSVTVGMSELIYRVKVTKSCTRPYASHNDGYSLCSPASSSQLTCASGPQAAHIHGGCARVAASVCARSVHLHVRLASLRKAHALIAQFDAPAQNSLTC